MPNNNNVTRGSGKPQQQQSRSAKVANALTKAGQVAGTVATVGSSVAKAVKAIATTIRAFTGNDLAWYVKYGQVTPAANKHRPMNALMMRDLTDELALGSVCKYIDVNVKWVGWTNTYVFDQVVTDAYQAIRHNLKSNLPYSDNKLKVYIGNCITLATYAKQYERDIHWVLYSDPDDFNWQRMYRLSSSSGSYGLQYLEPIPYLEAANYPNTISEYAIFQPAVQRNVFLPDALVRFISHYFGTLFTDSGDGFNDQTIKLNMVEMDWMEYKKEDDSINYTTIGPMSIEELTDKAIELGNDFGMLIADLNNSKKRLLTRVELTPYDYYSYFKVYDKTLLQALINGYTSRSAVLPNGYIRLDEMPGTSDPLTQYLFMGGLINMNNKSRSSFPPITILNMVYKYDTDGTLSIPAGLTAQLTSSGKFYPIRPFGISITTDIVADSYASATSSSGVQFAEFENELVLAGANTIKYGMIGNVNADGQSYKDAWFKAGSEPRVAKGTTSFVWAAIPLYAVYSNYNLRMFYVVQEFTVSWPNDASGPSITETTIASSSARNRTGFYMMVGPADEYVFASLVNAYAGHTLVGKSVDNMSVSDIMGEVRDILSEHKPESVTLIKWASNGPVTLLGEMAPVTNWVATEFGLYSYPIRPFVKGGSYVYRFETPNYDGGASVKVKDMIPENFAWNNVMFVDNANPETTTNVTVAIQSNFGLLAAFAADQFDYHIPIFAKNNVTSTAVITGGGGTTRTYSTGNLLVKEAYIPYMYNLLDLPPVLYKMMSSLFSIVDWRDIYEPKRNENYKSRKNNNKARENSSQSEQGPDK